MTYFDLGVSFLLNRDKQEMMKKWFDLLKVSYASWLYNRAVSSRMTGTCLSLVHFSIDFHSLFSYNLSVPECSVSLFCRGHGTYLDDNKILASVAGRVERVNKLICVRPLKTR